MEVWWWWRVAGIHSVVVVVSGDGSYDDGGSGCDG